MIIGMMPLHARVQCITCTSHTLPTLVTASSVNGMPMRMRDVSSLCGFTLYESRQIIHSNPSGSIPLGHHVPFKVIRICNLSFNDEGSMPMLLSSYKLNSHSVNPTCLRSQHAGGFYHELPNTNRSNVMGFKSGGKTHIIVCKVETPSLC